MGQAKLVTGMEPIMSAYKNVISRIGILAILMTGLIVIAEKPATAFTCQTGCKTVEQFCEHVCAVSNPTIPCEAKCISQYTSCILAC